MEETKAKKSYYIISALVILILVAIDQITKYFIYTNMTPYKDEKKVLGNALVIYFIKNTGAAWGSLSNKTIFLLVISILLVILLSYVYHNATKYPHLKAARICIVFIIGGAIGNMIDRIRFHYVVDFIYVKLINFPIFNFADICVTVCMFILLFLFIFKYKSEDIELLLHGKIRESVDSKEKETDEANSEETNLEETNSEE